MTEDALQPDEALKNALMDLRVKMLGAYRQQTVGEIRATVSSSVQLVSYHRLTDITFSSQLKSAPPSDSGQPRS